MGRRLGSLRARDLRVYDTFTDTIIGMVASTGKTLRAAAHPW